MYFTRNGDSFSVPIKPNSDGFTGRECPEAGCLGFFKVQFGTGLKGSNPCHCAYCGHVAAHNNFWTKQQLAYARSVVVNKVTSDLLRSLKKMEVRPDPRAFISIGIKVEGRPHPIHYYREPNLEQEVICDRCTLRYAIYGAFGYCPDCGVHNSLQILNVNLDIVEKMLALADAAEQAVAPKLIENALEDGVSAMDGFGREICRVFASKAADTATAKAISFQNLSGARNQVQKLFSVDIASPLKPEGWASLIRSFQKRHVLAHRMGVIDQLYLDRTGESPSLLGRRVTIPRDEVSELTAALRLVGGHLFRELERQPLPGK